MSMRKLLLFSLIPFLGFAQVQIGSDIQGVTDGDGFGSAVSLSSNGNVLAVGALYSGTGYVRVYRNLSGAWTQIGASIDGEINSESDSRVVSLSSDGNVIAIGSRTNSGNGFLAGHVRVFRNISDTWTQIGNDIDGNEGDASGFSISLSSDGTVLAIGAPSYSGNTNGSVRVYQNISSNWTQVGSNIIGEALGDYCGWSVSLSDDGNVLAIGAPYNNGNGGDSGHVQIYRKISDVWTQLGSDINGEQSNDYFGWSVSLSSNGSVVAIGAPYNDNANGVNYGHVRMYQNISDVWTQIGPDIDGDVYGHSFGYYTSLSSDGTLVAIGAQNQNTSLSSRISLYRNISGNWIQVGVEIMTSTLDVTQGDSIVSLASDGSKIAVGTPRLIDDSTGIVKVYDLTSILSSKDLVLSNFTIYPNPATDKVNIQLNENLQLEKVNIYNTLGQLIKTVKTATISVADLAKGNYFLEVVTNKGKANKPIIVE